MQGNVEEIITYMNKRFSAYEVFEPQLRNITRELIERGYTLDEIIQGINAYLLRLEPVSTDSRSREKDIRRSRTFRVLDERESMRIGPGAHGYLWLMREMGMLLPEEIEEIIAYIVENEMDVDSGEQLQMVMMDLILEREEHGDYQDQANGWGDYSGFDDSGESRRKRRRLN